MKYSAQDLYNYAKENEMVESLVQALYFNNRGFVARPLKGKLELRENQYYFVSQVNDDFTVEEPIGDGSEEQNQIIQNIIKHPEIMKVSIIAYQSRYQVRFAFANTEKERKEELNRKMIVGMLTSLEIDTIGKMRKLIEDSNETKASHEAMHLIGEGLKKKQEEENGKKA